MTQTRLQPGDLRIASLQGLRDALLQVAARDDTGRVHRDPPPLLRLLTDEEQAAEVRALANRLRDERPFLRSLLSSVNRHVQRVLDAATAKAAWSRFKHTGCLRSQLVDGGGARHSDRDEASFYVATLGRDGVDLDVQRPGALDDDIRADLQRDVAALQFLASVTQMCRWYRERGVAMFAQADDLALARAYSLLDAGVRMATGYRSIVTGPRRSHQTYLSFADAGEGHLQVTVRDRALLDGLIVHVEYIDRDNVDARDVVEAYRLPALRNAARVRLHVGNDTPCTAFIGRPVFEASFQLGLLKAAHTMAGVCSAMFAQGIADCKVAMDGMTAAQAVDFMRITAGNVVRDALRQRLSAAFNINSGIVDDVFSRGTPVTVTDRYQIAELAVRLVARGGFNKVAWDGASDERPSRPLIGQLSRAQLLALVHLAHERGLETYISAGMTSDQMRDATFIGVGGVGIGMSLHTLDDMKRVGDIDPAKVRHALETRNRAAQQTAGRAAALLAQLDWRYAEGSLPAADNPRRVDLFGRLDAYLKAMDVAERAAHEYDAGRITRDHATLTSLEAASSQAVNAVAAAEHDLRALVDSLEARFRPAPEDDPDRARPVGASSGDGAPGEEPAVEWARRVLAAAATATPGDASPVDAETLRQIRRRLESGDVVGLRTMVPF